VEKCGRARQVTGNNLIGRVLFAYWITKAETHSLIPHSEQNLLRNEALILRYTYFVLFVFGLKDKLDNVLFVSLLYFTREDVFWVLVFCLDFYTKLALFVRSYMFAF